MVPHVVVDEVKVVSWGDGCGASPTFGHTVVGLVQGLMDVHKGIDDCLAMLWLGRQALIGHRQVLRCNVLK